VQLRFVLHMVVANDVCIQMVVTRVQLQQVTLRFVLRMVVGRDASIIGVATSM
jgi:hypothetical protein